MVEYDGQIGREALKLHDPVGDGAERRDDQVWAEDLLLVQVREEGDGLQRLAEALPESVKSTTATHHLVGQDAVETVAVQLVEPRDALELVVAQLGAGDELGLADLIDLVIRERVDAALGRRSEVLWGQQRSERLVRTASSMTSAIASVLGAVAALRREPAAALGFASVASTAG